MSNPDSHEGAESSGARKRINFNFADSPNDIDRYMLLANKVGDANAANASVEVELHKTALDFLWALEKELKDTAWMFKSK